MDTSASIPSPAQNSAKSYDGWRDWHLRSWENAGLDWHAKGGVSFDEPHRKALGNPTRTVEHEERTWLVWEDPLYTVFVSAEQKDLDVPDGVGVEKAVEAYLWDLGELDKVLTRAEYQVEYDKGRILAEPHVRQIPSMELPDLRQFVPHYCDGSLICDHQVRDPSLLGMVFMPIALGGLSVMGPEEDDEGNVKRKASPGWDDYQKLPDAGDEPKREPEPEKPEKPKIPPRPPEPEYTEYDQDHEFALAAKADVPHGKVETVNDLFGKDEVEPSEVLAVLIYRESVDKKNAALRKEWEEAQAARVKQGKEWANDYREWKRRRSEWEARQADFDERHAVWARENAIAQAQRAGFIECYWQNIGCIYEYYSKAGPRSVNGYPCFFSLRMINKADWDRARPAIRRELERRENMER